MDYLYGFARRICLQAIVPEGEGPPSTGTMSIMMSADAEASGEVPIITISSGHRGGLHRLRETCRHPGPGDLTKGHAPVKIFAQASWEE